MEAWKIARWGLSLLCLAGPLLRAASPADLEYQVKAGFLFNFIKFVQWPRNRPGGEEKVVRVCVFGAASVVSTIASAMDGKTAGGQLVAVWQAGSASRSGACQVVFVSAGENRRADEILKAASGKSVLTISETPGFARAGGILNLIQQDNRIVFEVNIEAAKAAGVTLDSQLLRLGRIVKPPPRE
jgi:hypothetical protein